jgi:hypothetical protein
LVQIVSLDSSYQMNISSGQPKRKHYNYYGVYLTVYTTAGCGYCRLRHRRRDPLVAGGTPAAVPVPANSNLIKTTSSHM